MTDLPRGTFAPGPLFEAWSDSVERGNPAPPFDRAPAHWCAGRPIPVPVRTLLPLDPATATLKAEHTGDVLWEAGAPTKFGIEVFTAGDCWVLAWYLAHATGGRLVTLGWPYWRHVAVRLDRHDRNLYLDATGLRTRESLTTEWDLPVRPLDMRFIETFHDYEEALDIGFVYDITHGEASDFAHLLAATHLPALASAAAHHGRVA